MGFDISSTGNHKTLLKVNTLETTFGGGDR